MRRFVLLLLVAASSTACSRSDEGAERFAKAVQMSQSVTSLQIRDDKVGDGPEATPGRSVTVHYTGTLMDGTKFDSSRDRNEPFTFQLGARQVIPGWDEGVKGMRVGGTRHLTIPSSMAYGPGGSPPVIPPNAALQFDIELLAVK
jgi:FKBP-type peptidyl-prolyl cis-trans isomerase